MVGNPSIKEKFLKISSISLKTYVLHKNIYKKQRNNIQTSLDVHSLYNVALLRLEGAPRIHINNVSTTPGVLVLRIHAYSELRKFPILKDTFYIFVICILS